MAGKWKDGLFFYERDGLHLVKKLKLPVICSVWTKNKCPECGAEMRHYVELATDLMPLRIYACSCGIVTRTNRRP